MPTLRRATPDDAALITTHRHQMFGDNGFATEDRLQALDAAFEPWVHAHLLDGTYVGLLLEDELGKVVAGAGIYFQDFPPHWIDIQPTRAYLLNFYTAPAVRGQGFANLMLRECVDLCRARGLELVTLHASKFGRPIYEKAGFRQSSEMMLRFGSEGHTDTQ